MVLTVTLNPAIDKLLIMNNFEVHRLHRLEKEEMSVVGPGGKGVNVALNLSFLGDEVIASGFAGGHSGHLLCDSLRQKGITTNFIFTSGLTRTNISILDKAHATLSEINDFGQYIPPDDQQFLLDNYEKLLPRTDLVVLAGSLPEGVEVDYYGELIRMAHEKNKKVYLHVMPDYINKLSQSSPIIFHPDMRSFHELLGKPCDGIQQFIELGKELLVRNRKTEYVFFTHRIENAVVISRSKAYILRPINLKIVNMLGYNDAFIAGFVHAQLKGWNMEDSLRYASAAGLSNVENIYKELRSENDIERNQKRIEIEEII